MPDNIHAIADTVSGATVQRLLCSAIAHSFSGAEEDLSYQVLFENPLDPIQEAIEARLHARVRNISAGCENIQENNSSKTLYVVPMFIGKATVTREVQTNPLPIIGYSVSSEIIRPL